MPLPEASLDCTPIEVLEEGLDIVGSLQPVVDDKGMLENIQHQKGGTTCGVAGLMLVYPLVPEPTGYVILVQDSPTNPPLRVSLIHCGSECQARLRHCANNRSTP